MATNFLFLVLAIIIYLLVIIILSLRTLINASHATTNFLLAHRLYVDNDVFVEFWPNIFYVKDQSTKKVSLQGISDDSLYKICGAFQAGSSLKLRTLFNPSISMIALVPFITWNEKLGHHSNATIN